MATRSLQKHVLCLLPASLWTSASQAPGTDDQPRAPAAPAAQTCCLLQTIQLQCPPLMKSLEFEWDKWKCYSASMGLKRIAFLNPWRSSPQGLSRHWLDNLWPGPSQREHSLAVPPFTISIFQVPGANLWSQLRWDSYIYCSRSWHILAILPCFPTTLCSLLRLARWVIFFPNAFHLGMDQYTLSGHCFSESTNKRM